MQLRKSIFILSVFALLLPALAGACPAEVPRTGQTTCYMDNGTEIDCASTGQDGDWLAGVPWPDPRFTDRGDGTVSDNLTGLVWAKNANLLGTDDVDNDTDGTNGDGAVIWQHALDYIKKLNRESYLGYSDWRLPNINELESLVNAELYFPALPLNYPFTNVQSGYYWSSTSHAYDTYFAWIVYMDYGLVYSFFKTSYYFVWPVRAGQCGSFDHSIICLPRTGQTSCSDSAGTVINCAGTGQDGDWLAGVPWPDPRFSERADGTVSDNLTGLVWAKNANLLGTDDADNDTDDMVGDGMVTWQHALDYIKKLNRESYLGYNDWRLPNVNELESLVNAELYGPALPLNYPFTNVQSIYYWSSTSYAAGTGYAWVVDMDYGGGNRDETGSNIVWPVRAGQCGPLDTTTTTTIVGSTTTTPSTTSTTTSIISTTTTVGSTTTVPSSTTTQPTTTTTVWSTTTVPTTTTTSSPVETEPNNNMGEADGLTNGFEMSGQLSSCSDVDWFSVTTSGPDTIQISTDHVSDGYCYGTYLKITVYDAQSNVLANIVDLRCRMVFNVGVTAAGTYYIVIAPDKYHSTCPDSLTKPYTLVATWGSGSPAAETELNNNMGVADQLGSGISFSGQLSSCSDVDWFSVTTSGPDTIQISTDHVSDGYCYGTYLKITVYDALSNVLANIIDLGCSMDFNVGVSAGTYYIVIAPDAYHSTCPTSLTKPYTLTATGSAIITSTTTTVITTSTTTAISTTTTTVGSTTTVLSTTTSIISTTTTVGSTTTVPSSTTTQPTTTTTVGSTTTVPTTTTIRLTSTTTAPSVCTDNDGDGYGVGPGCAKEQDCNDNNSDVNPGADEICGDGIDNDCDGQTDVNCKRRCPFVNLLGDSNPNLANLRSFRDSTLAKNAIGRKIISIYYNNADSINAALERSPALRAFTKRILETTAGFMK